MSVQYRCDEILDTTAEAIILTSSCKGNLSNNSLLLSIKDLYPSVMRSYKKRCSKGKIYMSEPYLSKDNIDTMPYRFIFLPIRHVEGDILTSSQSLIAGFDNLVTLCNTEDIRSIAISYNDIGPLNKSLNFLDKMVENILSDYFDFIEVYTTELHASDKNNEFVFDS